MKKAIFAKLFWLLFASVLLSQEPEVPIEEQPGWKNTEIEYNPSQTDLDLQGDLTYFQGKKIRTELGPAADTPDPDVMPLSEELRALAHGLRNDPLRIFSFVRNEIESEFYFGLKKGPLATYHEGAGNDLDKCALLASLLEAARVNNPNIGEIRYCTGWQTLPYFSGSDQVPDICSLWKVSNFPAEGAPNVPDEQYLGHPLFNQTGSEKLSFAAHVAAKAGYSNPSRISNSGGNLSIRRFWIRMGSQAMDPWSVVRRKTAKSHVLTKLEIAPISDLTSIASGTENDQWYIPVISNQKYTVYDQVSDRLNGLVEEALSEIKSISHYGKHDTDELLGRYQTIKVDFQSFPSFSLVEQTSGLNLGAILASRVSICLGENTNNQRWEIATPTLNERRIWVEFYGSQAQLKAEGFTSPIKTYTLGTGSSVTLFTSFINSMTPLNAQSGFSAVSTQVSLSKISGEPVQSSSYHVLFYGYSPRQGTLRYRQARLDELMHRAERLFPGSTSSDAGTLWSRVSDLDLRKEIVLETLNTQGLTWLSQTALARRAVGDEFDVNVEKSFSLGRMSQLQTYFVDAFLQVTSPSSRIGKYFGKGGELAASYASMFIESALEHSLIEQSSKVVSLPGRDWSAKGASTISIIARGDCGVLVNGILPDADNSTGYWSSPIVSKNGINQRRARRDVYLNKLTSADQSQSQSGLDSNRRHPTIILKTSAGAAFFESSYTGAGRGMSGEGLLNPMMVQMSVGEAQGGYSVTTDKVEPIQYVSSIDCLTEYQMTSSVPGALTYADATYNYPEVYGADPVNMVNGSFDHAETDFQLGDGKAPTGLSFQRFYSSSEAHKAAEGMGFGWDHNWSIKIRETTAANLCMGEGNLRQMIPFLVAIRTLKQELIPPKYMADGVSVDLTTVSARRWAFCTNATYWLAEQFTRKAIALKLGQERETFIRMPDGSFEASGGSGMQLTKNESSRQYLLTIKSGNSILLDRLYGGYYYQQGRPISLTRPDGQVLEFLWGDKGLLRLEGSIGGATRGLYFTYYTNGAGLLKSVTLTSNNSSVSTEYEYDSNGNLIASTDSENKAPIQAEFSSSSKKTRYYYTDDSLASPTETIRGRMTRLVNAEGQTVTLNVYDELGRVSLQYQHGDTTKEPWRLFYNQVQHDEVDPYGGTRSYWYDRKGHLYQERDALGHLIHREFDDEGRMVLEVAADGSKVEKEYDVLNNPIVVRRYGTAGQSQADSWATSASYDENSRPLSIQDELGRVTTFTYQAGSKSPSPLTKTTGAKVTSWTYATTGWAKGLPLTMTDRDGLVTTYTYNSAGWLSSSKIGNEPAQQLLGHNLYGSPTSVIDESGKTEALVYNNRNQLIQSTKTDTQNANYKSVSRAIYDSVGRLAREEIETGRSGGKSCTAYTYSPTDKSLSQVSAGADGILGNSDDVGQYQSFDLRDWLDTETDAAGRVVKHTYLANGWEDRTDLPLEGPTAAARFKTYHHDSIGRVTGSHDVLGRHSQMGYSDFIQFSLSGGEAVKGVSEVATDPMNYQISKFNDASGRLRKMVDRRGKSYEFQYDVFDHLVATKTPDGKVFSKTYSGEGKVLTEKPNSAQEITYSYHPTNGRLASVSYPDATVLFTEYDAKGLLKKSSEGGKEISRTYDAFDRVKTYTNSEGWTIGYEYYNDGLLKKIYYPEKDLNPFDNPYFVSYEYDQSGKLTGVRDWNNRLTSYIWKKDGRLERINRPNGSSRALFYDYAARLQRIEERSNSQEIVWFSNFGYRKTDDLSGRFIYPDLPVNQVLNPVTSTVYSDDNALASINGIACEHDARGNMTKLPLTLGASATTSTLSFDWRDRLVAVGNSTTYTYDHENLRVKMTRGTAESEYVFDPHGGPLVRMLMRKDSDGKIIRAVYGLGLEYEEEIPAPAQSPVVRYHHVDHTGSSVALSDGNGTVYSRRSYDPYGRVLYGDAFWNSSFAYSGYFGVMTDPDGLVWMRARFYSPLLGRFISMDPARFEGGMNWYAYADGNPMRFADPTGLDAEDTLDALQSTLEVVGMLPIIGPAADLINAGISLARGNYAEAGMHFLSAVPGLGDFAQAGKIASKASGAMSVFAKTERSAAKSSLSAAKGGLRQTGAGGLAGSADDAYAAIRASTDDVAAIAGHTGIKPGNIQKVKDHIFYNEHLLDRYVDHGVPAYMSRFDSHEGIAAAWQRLSTGKGTAGDMSLLRHEAAEAWFMRKHGPGYNAAHEAAQRRYPSGF